MNQEQTVTLTLTVAEVNTVLALVAKGPFETVYQLVNKIKTDAEAQLQAPAPAEQLNG